MARKPRKMKFKHNFPMRQVNPITGDITMQNQPHKVFIPGEVVTLLLNADGVQRSKDLRGRGNSQTCSGSLCVWMQRDCFTHPVTGVVDFLYARVFIQSDARKRECYGYEHSCDWFPKLNDKKGGHDLLLQKIKDNGGPIPMILRPIRVQAYSGKVGKYNGTRPRRSPKKRGSHLRAAVGAWGLENVYSELGEAKGKSS